MARPPASFESISTRVEGLEEDFRKLDLKFDTQVAALRSDFSVAIAGLHSKLDRQAQPQWGVIYAGLGVMVSVLGIIGVLVFVPFRERQQELHAQLIGYKTEYQKDIDDLIRRDQRIWDAIMHTQGQVNRIDGRLNRQP